VLAQALVDLDQVHVAGELGQSPGQHPLPAADLENHLARAEVGIGQDRVEQVRVGEEVLA
jgi:hypothetical protein